MSAPSSVPTTSRPGRLAAAVLATVAAGPIDRWIAALERILDMDLVTILPGHGPVRGKAEVGDMREYLVHVQAQARRRFEEGLSVDEAIDTIDLGRWAGLPEHGRLAQNVINVYQQLDPSMDRPERLTVLGRIAKLEGFGLTTSTKKGAQA